MTTHQHNWVHTPEEDAENVTRYKCECGARGWCTRFNRLKFGSKAPIIEYKHPIKDGKRELTVNSRRTSDGKVGVSVGWHGKAK